MIGNLGNEDQNSLLINTLKLEFPGRFARTKPIIYTGKIKYIHEFYH